MILHIFHLIAGKLWKATGRFPRVTLCDFEIRELGNTNQHTVQCVLPINLFNEKIYVFLWFWFVFVATVTIFNLVHWFVKIIHTDSGIGFVKRHLKSMDRINRETDMQVKKFCSDYLRTDGIFVIRLLAKNAGDLTAAEIIAGLFDVYGRGKRLLIEIHPRPPLASMQLPVPPPAPPV